MSNQQLNRIHKCIHPLVISSKYFNQKWPKELKYGNHKHSGLNIVDLRVEQRFRKIQLTHNILSHPKHNILMYSIIFSYHLLSRLSSPILFNPPNNIKYINSDWLQDLIIFYINTILDFLRN